MQFVQNFPFFCILLTLICAVITSVIGRRKAIYLTSALITAVTAMTVCVLVYVLRTGESYTYMMGHFPAPWGNEIRIGVMEALMMTVFCFVTLFSFIGGLLPSIREIESTDPLLRGKEIYGVADPSIFDESRGQSIAAMMGAHPNYVLWSPGENTRLAGLAQCHYRLAFDDEGECMFQVFNTNKHFIRTIPGLVHDENKVEDVDTSMEDHIYDEWRYVMQENPISPPLPKLKEIKPFNPLSSSTRARIFD